MKMPMGWHEWCLKNSKENLAREEETFARLTAAIERFRKQVAFHEAQIAEAQRQGKDGFDQDKFMKKK